MADISTAKIKELRDRTSAGILDCKKALVATEGDMEKAVTWLREKGIAKANKKAGAVAAEGVTSYVVDGNKAVLFEVNCQTDFVSANEKFKALVEKIGQVLIKSNAKTAEDALKETVGATDLNTMILQESGVLGEKITLRRIAVVEKNADQVFGVYKYMGGKISSIVLMNGGSEKVANDIAMHVIAANTEYVSSNDIPQDKVAQEKEVILKEALNENAQSAKPKPEQIIIDKIVPGRLEKAFKEICLLSQMFIMDANVKISDYLNNNKATVVSFIKFKVGDGIEKQETDFAAEVAAQAAAFQK